MKNAKRPKDFMIMHRPHDDDDETPLRPLEWGLIKRLFQYTAPIRRKTRVLMLLTVVRSMQIPAIAWAGSLVIAGPIAGHKPGVLAWAILLYGVLGLLTDGLFHFRQRYALELGETVVFGLRKAIFEHVQSMPMSFFQKMKLGRIISRMTSDVEALRVGIQDVLFVSSIQAGQMLFAAVIMLYCDWAMFLVVLGMAPVLWLVNRRFHGKLSEHSRAAQASFSRITATLAESVNGIRVTQGFVRQQTNAGLFRSLLADHSRYSIALARTSAILIPLLELNSQFFVAVLLIFGGWRVSHGSMTIEAMIQFFFLANMFFAPINIIGNQYNQALVAMASAERVFKLLDMKPDWKDAEDATELPDPRKTAEKTGKTAPLGASVELRDVSFGYDPAKTVLKNVSFKAEPGQMIALVGHTGSGKSTIINLVSKFYIPSAGTVLIDGRDLAGVTGSSLHRQMGIVPQQSFLFSGSLMDNIRFSRPEASDEEVVDAVRRLDCLDLFEALPKGLTTEVGERGAGLSVGQRQLACFARALIADPRLLIFDEATSSIDALTEARIQKALVELLKGRTSFVVAHRLSTIRHADLVLVLDNGCIIERGTHDQLLAKGGQYAHLYEQFARVDAGAA